MYELHTYGTHTGPIYLAYRKFKINRIGSNAHNYTFKGDIPPRVFKVWGDNLIKSEESKDRFYWDESIRTDEEPITPFMEPNKIREFAPEEMLVLYVRSSYIKHVSERDPNIVAEVNLGDAMRDAVHQNFFPEYILSTNYDNIIEKYQYYKTGERKNIYTNERKSPVQWFFPYKNRGNIDYENKNEPRDYKYFFSFMIKGESWFTSFILDERRDEVEYGVSKTHPPGYFESYLAPY